MAPNNFIPVKCTEQSFFRAWVEFFAPFHKLTARERDIMARILAQYFKLKKNVKDEEVLYEILWSHTSKKDMRESLGASPAYFQLVVKTLREHGVLTDRDRINPKYLPYITDDPRLLLYVLFDWSSLTNPIKDALKQDETKQD